MLVERFGFLKYPTSVNDFDETKGVEFVEGHFEGTTVDKIIVWSNGIQVDTRASTQVSQEILHSTLLWLKEEAGLTYESGMIKRWAHLSDVAFHSDVNFDAIHPALIKLCASVSREVSILRGAKFDYEFTGMSFSFDRSIRQAPVAAFLLQRRAETPFSENKYFSEAPLPTDIHIKLLEELEADLSAPPRLTSGD